jgi:hypothetical protein
VSFRRSTRRRRRSAATVPSAKRAACMTVLALTVAGCGASGHHASDQAPTAKRVASTSTQTVATATAPQRTNTGPVPPLESAAGPSVLDCLKRAGLGHVAETSEGRWQGVVRDHPLSDEVASVFVTGPYATAAAVREAVPTAGSGENAAAGGLYLLVGTTAGHTAAPIKIAAHCLRPSASTASHTHSKGYTF